jgi:hypothetical protein
LELVILSTATPTEVKGLEQVWSVEGDWGGVTSDNLAGIVHATKLGRMFDIDASGKILNERTFPTHALLRTARFDGTAAFLGFGTWSPAVTAYDSAGNQLWTA